MMVVVGAVMGMMSGTLVYYHCAYRDSSVVSLFADVFIVLLCSLAILGLLFRHMNVAVPVDPLHWQISQDAATSLFACLANTLGATESVLRVAATGHDKRLFLKDCAYSVSTSLLRIHKQTANVRQGFQGEEMLQVLFKITHNFHASSAIMLSVNTCILLSSLQGSWLLRPVGHLCIYAAALCFQLYTARIFFIVRLLSWNRALVHGQC